MALNLLEMHAMGGHTAMHNLGDWYEKRDLFLEMRNVALQQRDLIRENQMDHFLKLSGLRNGLQRRIAAKGARNASLKGEHPPFPEGKTRLVAREIQEIIQSIRDIDREIEKFITEKKEEMSRDIHTIRKRKKGIKGYGGKTTKRPRFIDTQG